jgi:hypothetical protein
VAVEPPPPVSPWGRLTNAPACTHRYLSPGRERKRCVRKTPHDNAYGPTPLQSEGIQQSLPMGIQIPDRNEHDCMHTWPPLHRCQACLTTMTRRRFPTGVGFSGRGTGCSGSRALKSLAESRGTIASESEFSGDDCVSKNGASRVSPCTRSSCVTGCDSEPTK